MALMAACRSSRFLPVTRTLSPWMLLWTLILHSLMSLMIFLAVSWSMPWRTVISRLTFFPLAWIRWIYYIGAHDFQSSNS